VGGGVNTLTTLAAAGGPLAAGWGAHASLLTRRARLARRDPLTGLPTREEFTRRAVRLVRRPGAVVVFVDLDGFKAVNDTHGHAAGDAVLCPALGPALTLSRVHACLTQPVDFEGRALRVGASVGGVACDQLPTRDVSLALRLADEAMYTAKRAGGGWRTGAPGLPAQATVNGRRAGREGAHGAGVAS
jgi:GGDEF domain-containing protein